MTTMHLATFPLVLVGGKFIDGVKGAAAGMAIGAAVKWAMTPTSQEGASPNLDGGSPSGSDSGSSGSASPDGVTTEGGLTVKYGEGLDKLEAAVEEYGVLKLFKGMPTDGNHTINVSINNSIDSFMSVPNSSTILVNAEVLNTTPSNMVGSGFGHELSHVSDYLNGSLSRTNVSSVRASEVRAYNWQFSTRNHFNLNLNQKTWVRGQIESYR